MIEISWQWNLAKQFPDVDLWASGSMLITEKEGAPAKMQTNGTTEAEQKKDSF